MELMYHFPQLNIAISFSLQISPFYMDSELPSRLEQPQSANDLIILFISGLCFDSGPCVF